MSERFKKVLSYAIVCAIGAIFWTFVLLELSK
jgi:hypothetical protein